MTSLFLRFLLLANTVGSLIVGFFGGVKNVILGVLRCILKLFRWGVSFIRVGLQKTVSGVKKAFTKVFTFIYRVTGWFRQVTALFFSIIFSKLVLLGVVGILIGINGVFYFQSPLIKDLKTSWDRIPNPHSLSDFQMPAATLIYDQKGTLLYSTYTDSNRIPTTLQSVPPFMVEATLAAEDKRFYQHHGIDLVSFVRASFHNLISSQKQGGSTLTQQVARSVFLNRQKTLSRKMMEAVIALRMEQNLTKNQILELYFNTTPYGGNAIGVEAAAQQYFGKSVSELTDKEALFLVSITPAPTVYGRDQRKDSPRIQYVLGQMRENKQITDQKYTELLTAPLTFAPQITYKRAPHAVDYILNELVQKFGEDTLNQGLVVKSSIDLDTQNRFQQMVSEEVALHSKTFQFSNASALVVTPQDGRIISMVGSANYFDLSQGQVNLTTSPRQLGSTMKIVPYSYALEHGFTPETMIADVPTTFKDYNNYTPHNYDHNFHGNISLKQAFANSYNIPALKVTHQLGVGNVAQFGVQMGIEEFAHLDTKPPLSLAIGGVETTLEHLTQAYQIIANNGQKVPLSIIDSVTDFHGQSLYNRKVESTQVVEPKTATQIFAILSDPKARQSAFGHPAYFAFPEDQVAIKSGTSNDLRDNVTFSFTRSFVVATWVGNNDGSNMRNVASGYSGASVIMHEITTYLLNNSVITNTTQTQNLAERR